MTRRQCYWLGCLVIVVALSRVFVHDLRSYVCFVVASTVSYAGGLLGGER